jgi:hypothetical protein
MAWGVFAAERLEGFVGQPDQGVMERWGAECVGPAVPARRVIAGDEGGGPVGAAVPAEGEHHRGFHVHHPTPLAW